MRKVVIDTNVIISAALSPKGNPAKIIALIAGSDDIQLYYSVDILAEYTEVLSRPYLKISVNLLLISKSFYHEKTIFK